MGSMLNVFYNIYNRPRYVLKFIRFIGIPPYRTDVGTTL